MGAITALLMEKSNTEDMIKGHANMLIRVIKLIDKKVIRVEALEYWQKLKVHKMSLVQYLGKKKMKLLW